MIIEQAQSSLNSAIAFASGYYRARINKKELALCYIIKSRVNYYPVFVPRGNDNSVVQYAQAEGMTIERIIEGPNLQAEFESMQFEDDKVVASNEWVVSHKVAAQLTAYFAALSAWDGIIERPRLDLSYARIKWSNFNHLDLSHADLSYAHIGPATLHTTNLSYANLSYATLSDVVMINAKLDYANLEGAKISHSNMSGVDLSNVRFKNTMIDKRRFD